MPIRAARAVDAIAIHEAGHTLVAYALGITVREVSVRSTWDWDGHIEFAECAPEDELHILVAGDIAEQRASTLGLLDLAPRGSPRSRRKAARKEFVARVEATRADVDEPSEPDEARIDYLLGELQPDPDLRRDLYTTVVVATYQTIAARWGDLERLASVLVSRWTLNGSEVINVIDGGDEMEHFTNGHGGELERAIPYEPLLAGEIVRPGTIFNKSGTWTYAEREQWFNYIGLDREDDEDGNDD